MTLTILASVSLLALVSSARPLPQLEADEDAWKGLQVSASGEDADVQQVIQAVVKSHASLPEDLKEEEDVYVQLASNEEVQEYLSNADSDAIKALIPINQDELHSPDEKELYELLNRLEEERAGSTPVPDDVLDTLTATPDESDTKTQAAEFDSSSPTEKDIDINIPKDIFTSTPVIVMAVSCAIALLTIICVAVVLYTIEMLRKIVFCSTWGILPQLEKNLLSQQEKKGEVSPCGRRDAIEGGLASGDAGSEKMPGALIITVTDSDIASTAVLRYLRPNLPRKTSRTTLTEMSTDEPASASDTGEELEEKFFDAELPAADMEDGVRNTTSTTTNPPAYSPKLFPTSDPTDFPPGLPTLAAAVVQAPRDNNSTNMPEVTKSDFESRIPIASNSSSRPSWSVRAQEAGALVHAQDHNQDHKDYSQQERRRRAGMFAAPQLDAALAMQLRPGLGIGADAAWLVRFVMALFGWCAVLMSGGTWGLLA